MTRLGCYLPAGRSLERSVERVKLADELGYEAVFVSHLAGYESLTVLTAYGCSSEQIDLGTGVVPIYSRTPATMAQTALTIDALTGGRLILGLGVSHRPIVEGWHGQRIDHPVADMREYVSTLRAIFSGTEPETGGRWPTKFKFSGVDLRPNLRIYLAALSPAMLRLAGEVADGVLLWLCTPEYIREVVVPAVTEGREAAGKTLDGFVIAPAVPAAVTDVKSTVADRLREDLLVYFGLPFYRTMLERSGYSDELAAFDRAEGNRDLMRAAISDRFLDDLNAFGDLDEVAAGVDRYLAAGTTLPCLAPIAGCDRELTLRAAAAF